MRSSDPSIETALEQMKFWGAEQLTLMPLFPAVFNYNDGNLL